MNFCERVWAEVNLDVLGNNMLEIRNALEDTVKIMAVVKADGYGHGAFEAAKTFLDNGVDYLAVAICDEGIALRQKEISEPILVLGYTNPTQLKLIINYDLTQTIFDFESAKQISETALKLNKMADIHIKVDTGMNRLGFLPNEDSLKDITHISKLKGINIKGIYTHFVQSGKCDTSFTVSQLNIFNKFVADLEKMGVKIPLKHGANSAAIIRNKDFHLDMVRPGIISYGLTPLDEEGFSGLSIAPAMTIKTIVAYVKTLEEGVSIGYNRTYFTKRKTRVATLPVGYADGYLRALGNKGRVLVNGEFAPIIGGICMDQFMVDVTDIPETKCGDIVVLMGKQGGLEISAEEIAGILNTINYEVVCTISKRVPRVYIKNNEIIKKVNMICDL